MINRPSSTSLVAVAAAGLIGCASVQEHGKVVDAVDEIRRGILQRNDRPFEDLRVLLNSTRGVLELYCGVSAEPVIIPLAHADEYDGVLVVSSSYNHDRTARGRFSFNSYYGSHAIRECVDDIIRRVVRLANLDKKCDMILEKPIESESRASIEAVCHQ